MSPPATATTGSSTHIQSGWKPLVGEIWSMVKPWPATALRAITR